MEYYSFGTLFESLKYSFTANSRRIRPKDTGQNISNQQRHMVTVALLAQKEEKSIKSHGSECYGKDRNSPPIYAQVRKKCIAII